MFVLKFIVWEVMVPTCLALAAAKSFGENAPKAVSGTVNGARAAINYFRGTPAQEKDKDEEAKQKDNGRQ